DACYYRMLLNIAKGCRTHDEIKMVNGVVYPTYKEACYTSGLLEDDKEYVVGIKDAAHWAPPKHLRELFVTLLSQKELTTPLTVWLQTWHLLAQDVQYKRRQVLNIPDLIISDDEKKNVCLLYMEELLRSRGCSLRNWPEMPYPDSRYITEIDNRLIYDETDYKPVELQTKYERIRRRGDIVLNVESSGIASLLMSGGRTAHSRFHISINIDETSTCSISAQSDLGALLKKCKLIIWDEAPMANKHCFEALDRSLRDILRKSRYDTCDQPFGNMTMVFDGDFRQVLPVIPKGQRQDIVSASLKQSYLWDHCKVLKLTKNMRLTVGAQPEDVTEIRDFAEWILKVGDGELGEENDGEVEMDVPEEILIDQGDDPVASIVDFTYPDILDDIHDPSYFKEKAVLAPTNEVVDNINEHLLDKFPGEEMVYLSCDSVDKTERNIVIDKAILTGIYQWIEVLWCTQL
ncbi:ATP-dependent DNA helicase RRM3-like protein, partial [Tanacetum coccineum]